MCHKIWTTLKGYFSYKPKNQRKEHACSSLLLWFFHVFQARSQKCGKRLLASFLPFLLSIRMKNLRSHWTDFHKIWHLEYLSEICRENSSSIKIRQENEYFAWRPAYIYDKISVNSSKNEIRFRQNLYRKSKHTNVFLENRAVCETTWKNVLEPVRPLMTIRRMRFAFWITKATYTYS